ncbi:MAG: 3-dehydroquinate dehydratase [Rickettsiales bacterium]|nr:3-dehydroquinate dehydratase [Rickettsiales bacterium]|tara:strand:- start:740 stop:1186 length:447 start_codon:yes stop_codon:yes gene_type:complete
MNKILIINGPNLNMLGTREIEIYGKKTLSQIKEDCEKFSRKMNYEINFFQTNSESEIIGCLQSMKNKYVGLIINAAALTHTSIAIHDSLKIVSCKKIEIHISNPFSRENFRNKSFISPVVDGVISGLGHKVYITAIFAIKQMLEKVNE